MNQFIGQRVNCRYAWMTVPRTKTIGGIGVVFAIMESVAVKSMESSNLFFYLRKCPTYIEIQLRH